jgi:phage-related protein
VTSNNDDVQFGTTLDGEPVGYTPWPMSIGKIVRTKKGDLPQMTITVSNAKRALPGYLETYDGLVGQPAVLQLVSLGELNNADAALRFDGEVMGAEVSAEQVTFTIGSVNLKQLKFPSQRFVKEHCRFRFGGALCGYNVNHPNATYSTCPRTYAACDERGDDEENVMGVTRQHPKRFGGWRAIPLG